MKIYSEISLANFEPWSGAIYTFNRVIEEGKADELETVLEDCYPEGMTETQLNDILWFESDWVFEMCGIRTESEIREELEETKEELAELEEEWKNDVEILAEERNIPFESAEYVVLASEVWEKAYSEDGAELREKIEELTEELENI